MKSTIIATGLAAIILGLAGIASAQDASSQGPHYYVNLGVNQVQSHDQDTKLNDLGLGFGAKFNPYFGVEGNLAYGTHSDTGQNGSYKLTHKVGAYAVGYLPLDNHFSLLARAGLANTTFKNEDTMPHIEQGASRDLGVGAQYDIANGYGIRADVTHSEYSGQHGQSTTLGVSAVKSF